MKNKRRFISVSALALIVATAGATLTLQSLKKQVIVGNATECAEGKHSGNHYNERLGTSTKTGNKEFWACCKCHRQYLDNPGGTFTDSVLSDDQLLEDIDHVAYLPDSNHYLVEHSIQSMTTTGTASKRLYKNKLVEKSNVSDIEDVKLDLNHYDYDAATKAIDIQDIPETGVIETNYVPFEDRLVNSLTYAYPFQHLHTIGPAGGAKNKDFPCLDTQEKEVVPINITNYGTENGFAIVDDSADDEDGTSIKIHIGESNIKWYGFIFTNEQYAVINDSSKNATVSYYIKADESYTTTDLDGTTFQVTTEWQKRVLSADSIKNVKSNTYEDGDNYFGRYNLFNQCPVDVYFDCISVEAEASYTVNHRLYLDSSKTSSYLYKTENKSGIIGENTAAEAISVDGFTADPFSQVRIQTSGTEVNIYYIRNMLIESFQEKDLGWYDSRADYATRGKVTASNNTSDARYVNNNDNKYVQLYRATSSDWGSYWVTYWLNAEQEDHVKNVINKMTFRIRLVTVDSSEPIDYPIAFSDGSSGSISTITAKPSAQAGWTTVTVSNLAYNTAKNMYRLQFYLTQPSTKDGIFLFVDDFSADVS